MIAMGSGRTAARGAAVNMMAITVRLFLNVLVTLPILARILSPEEFGLASMAMTLILFLVVFNDFGIAPALVRAQDSSTELWSTAIWSTSVIALVLTCAAYLMSPLLASFYMVPEVEPLAKVLSLAIGLQVIYAVPIAWLQREEKMTSIAMIDICSVVVSSAIALGFAFGGAGVWAIVYQQIAMPIVKCVMALVMAKLPIGLVYRWSKMKPLLGFSLMITASTCVIILNRRADKLLVGRYMTTETLGLYDRAWMLSQLPNQIISQGIGFAAYPAMAKVQHDQTWLGQMYLKLTGAVAWLSFPLAAFLATASRPFIEVLLGTDWRGMAPIFTLMVLAGAVQSLVSTGATVQKVYGLGSDILKWSFIRMTFFLPTFALGIYLGSTKLLAGLFLLANLLLLIPFQLHITRLLKLRLSNVLKEWVPPTVCSVIMVIGMLGAGHFSPDRPIIELVLLFLVGSAAFFGSMLLLFPADLKRYLAYGSYFTQRAHKH